MAEVFLKTGGVYHIALAVYHLLFWRLFNWQDEFSKLSAFNEAIIRALNLSLTFALVIFGYLSLAHTHELLATPLGRALLMLIALFWLARAMQQLLFFQHRDWDSRLFFGLFLLGTALYAFPALWAR